MLTSRGWAGLGTTGLHAEDRRIPKEPFRSWLNSGVWGQRAGSPFQSACCMLLSLDFCNSIVLPACFPSLNPLPGHRAIFFSISGLFCSEPLFSHFPKTGSWIFPEVKARARGGGVLSPPQPSVLLSSSSPLHSEVLKMMPQLRTMSAAVNRIALPPRRRGLWSELPLQLPHSLRVSQTLAVCGQFPSMFGSSLRSLVLDQGDTSVSKVLVMQARKHANMKSRV